MYRPAAQHWIGFLGAAPAPGGKNPHRCQITSSGPTGEMHTFLASTTAPTSVSWKRGPNDVRLLGDVRSLARVQEDLFCFWNFLERVLERTREEQTVSRRGTGPAKERK